MKLPSLQFYSGDWMKDPALRSVSFAARGLWIDMLMLMHQSPRRGYLQLNDTPVTAAQLARMTGGATGEVARLLRELEDSGVYSRTDSGTIYNRRMVRDEKKRIACSEAGRRGGGNPILTFKGDSKGGVKGRSKGEIKASSSSSSSTSVDIPPNPPLQGGQEIPKRLTRAERKRMERLGIGREYGSNRPAPPIAEIHLSHADAATILWPDAKQRLSEAVDPDAFSTWLDPMQCRGIDAEGKRAWFLAPSEFFRNWIAHNYAPAIGDALGCGDWEIFVEVEE